MVLKIKRTSKDDIEEMLVALHDAKAKKEQIEQEVKRLNTALSDMLRGMGRKTVTVHQGDKRITGTYTRRTTIKYDEDALEKILGKQRFNRLTKKVLDKKKLEASVLSGEIDAMDVAKASDEKVSEYVTVREKTVG